MTAQKWSAAKTFTETFFPKNQAGFHEQYNTARNKVVDAANKFCLSREDAKIDVRPPVELCGRVVVEVVVHY